ncbi:MAG TPA: ABC transporter ATP-binding protein, partial [Aggregatilineales bacterium]|nr:ABC transporter ATP-binding protein [Aggregatilineales bacterium]
MPLIQLTDITLYPDEHLLQQSVEKVGSGLFGKLGLGTRPDDNVRHKQPAPPLPKPILDNLTLTIRHHETLALLGPSGSGKSTLIKIIAGLIKPTSGTISYNGQDMANVPPRERRIGMVFQQQALYQNMTSEENIGFYYELRGQPEQIPQRIRDVSRLMDVDLEPLLARRPPKLSGGERQRIAIARALAREVDIFLFDEPLSHLDPPLRIHLRGSMHRVFIMHPVTTVYVTHDQTEAMALADRIAILRDGKIEQIGTTAELFQRPHNTFVADFFGNCNLLPGFIRGDRWQLGDVILYPPPA